MMVVSTEIEAKPFDQFLDECKKDYEQVQTELKEIDLLIQQTTAEVERLTRRNTQTTNRLRHAESSLDTIPREDLKEMYSAVLDTQQRLFTMQGQLEKLQSDQRHRVRHLALLRGMLQIIDRAEYSIEASSEEGETAQPLIVRIIEAQERERQGLSRMMHDGPAQALTNLILQAEICERLFLSDPERARVELGNLKNSVAATFQKVKGYIINLRPMMLDDLGLVPTLRRYVGSFSENSGVLTTLTVTGRERRFAAHKEVTIFRLAQELLSNASDYSHASSIQINLDLGEDLIRMAIEDNGSGFEVTELLSSPDADRLGLTVMRERVEMLGGQIHIDSGLGRGTKVALELPSS